MTPIEIMALIFAVFVTVKISTVLISPKSWMGGFMKKAWSNPTLTALVSLVLAAVALFYLLKELTIVQIFAVMFFLMLLLMISFASYANDMLALGNNMLKEGEIVKKARLTVIIWSILVIWAFYALFA
ncbi:MAG: hypothetical protein KKI07_00665 [Euryarchaeota archaeon]|nr:hypothetical protein [Euryarchaeota archaeon]